MFDYSISSQYAIVRSLPEEQSDTCHYRKCRVRILPFYFFFSNFRSSPLPPPPPASPPLPPRYRPQQLPTQPHVPCVSVPSVGIWKGHTKNKRGGGHLPSEKFREFSKNWKQAHLPVLWLYRRPRRGPCSFYAQHSLLPGPLGLRPASYGHPLLFEHMYHS